MWSSTKMWGRTSRTSSQGRKWYQTSPARQEPLCLQWVHILYLINVTFCWKSLEVIQKSLIFMFSLFLMSFILSAPSTATMLMKTAQYTAQASASPPSPWTARSGQPRAATATWLMHSGTSRSLTTWLLLILCCRLCAFHRRFGQLFLILYGVSQLLTHLNTHSCTNG